MAEVLLLNPGGKPKTKATSRSKIRHNASSRAKKGETDMVQRHFGGRFGLRRFHNPGFGMFNSPFPKHKKGKKHKRNPGFLAATKGAIVHPFSKDVGFDLLAMTIGAAGTTLIPALVMKDKNVGLKSYGFNLITSILLGTATKLITKKTELAAKVMLGGLLATALRAISQVAMTSSSKVAMAYTGGAMPSSFSGLGISKQEQIRRQIESQITAALQKGVSGHTTLPYKTIDGRTTLPYKTLAQATAGLTTLPYKTIGIGLEELGIGEQDGISADTM